MRPNDIKSKKMMTTRPIIQINEDFSQAHWDWRYGVASSGIESTSIEYDCVDSSWGSSGGESDFDSSFKISLCSVWFILTSLEVPYKLAPQAGFEPATDRLTADCSTTELLRSDNIEGVQSTAQTWKFSLTHSPYANFSFPSCQQG